MPQTTLNVRMNKEIKERFDAFCQDAGMNASTAVNLFVRAALRENRIPFKIAGSADPFYSLKNQARLKEAMDQLDAGKGQPRELIEPDND